MDDSSKQKTKKIMELQAYVPNSPSILIENGPESITLEVGFIKGGCNAKHPNTCILCIRRSETGLYFYCETHLK